MLPFPPITQFSSNLLTDLGDATRRPGLHGMAIEPRSRPEGFNPYRVMKADINHEKIQQLKRDEKFICPNCGCLEDIRNKHVRAVLVGCESKDTFMVTHTRVQIKSSYLNVRSCPKCKNVRNRNKWLRHIAFFLLGPLVWSILMALLYWDFTFSWKIYGVGLLICFFAYVPAVRFFREDISPALNKGLINKAIEGNAID